jgi:hypothetical protein
VTTIQPPTLAQPNLRIPKKIKLDVPHAANRSTGAPIDGHNAALEKLGVRACNANEVEEQVSFCSHLLLSRNVLEYLGVNSSSALGHTGTPGDCGQAGAIQNSKASRNHLGLDSEVCDRIGASS